MRQPLSGPESRPVPVAAYTWAVPAEVRLVEDPAGDRLVWTRFTVGDHARAERWVTRRELASDTLLRQFIALADRPAARIRGFAERWGVLGLCQHRVPAPRSPFVGQTDHGPFADAGHATSPEGCPPLGTERNGGYQGWEPVAAWQAWAREARAIQQVARSLQAGRVGTTEDWRAALARFPVRDRFWPPSLRADRLMLVELVSSWLGLGRVRPSLVWPTRDRPTSMLLGIGLFGALAGQLYLFVCQADGSAICAACGRVLPVDRRPSVGRRHYCTRCRSHGQDVADASRAYRARRREALALLDQGRSPAQVAEDLGLGPRRVDGRVQSGPDRVLEWQDARQRPRSIRNG